MAVRVIEVALANVEIIEREGLVERAASVGAWFQQQLRSTLENLPIVGQVRGIGMMAAVELVPPDTALVSVPVPVSLRVPSKLWPPSFWPLAEIWPLNRG